jgi:hypothetical protein
VRGAPGDRRPYRDASFRESRAASEVCCGSWFTRASGRLPNAARNAPSRPQARRVSGAPSRCVRKYRVQVVCVGCPVDVAKHEVLETVVALKFALEVPKCVPLSGQEPSDPIRHAFGHSTIVALRELAEPLM